MQPFFCILCAREIVTTTVLILTVVIIVFKEDCTTCSLTMSTDM